VSAETLERSERVERPHVFLLAVRKRSRKAAS
jgi:hypothetical protein